MAPTSMAQTPTPSMCEEMRASSQASTRTACPRGGSSQPMSFSTAQA